jgi:hypothetical protein
MVKLMGVIIREDKRDSLKVPRDIVRIWVVHGKLHVQDPTW